MNNKPLICNMFKVFKKKDSIDKAPDEKYYLKDRHRFFRTCQKIVDELYHEAYENKKFVPDNECRQRYGAALFNSFLFELKREGLEEIRTQKITQALYWAHYSRFFLWVANSERQKDSELKRNRIVAWASLCVSVIALVVAVI